MKTLLLLPLLAFSAADTWQPFVIDRHVSVELPGQPTEADLTKLAPGRSMGHTRMWMLRTPEGAYQFMRLPNKGIIEKSDSAGRRAFYAGVLVSLLRNEQGQLLASTPFPTAAGPGVEYKYKAVHRGTGKRVIKYTRCLVIDSVAYSLNYISFDKLDTLGLAGDGQRRHFFNSIIVKP